jgi:hypothetical protein
MPAGRPSTTTGTGRQSWNAETPASPYSPAATTYATPAPTAVGSPAKGPEIQFSEE